MAAYEQKKAYQALTASAGQQCASAFLSSTLAVAKAHSHRRRAPPVRRPGERPPPFEEAPGQRRRRRQNRTANLTVSLNAPNEAVAAGRSILDVLR